MDYFYFFILLTLKQLEWDSFKDLNRGSQAEFCLKLFKRFNILDIKL